MTAISGRVQAIAGSGVPSREPAARLAVRRRPPDAAPVLSFDQERLWLESQLRPGAAYNIHGRMRLRGDLDVAVLGRSIRVILERHEALRSRFPLVNGQPTQQVDDLGEDWRISFEDLSGIGGNRRDAAGRLADQQAATVFDLAAGPLFRCLLIKLGDADHLLSITMHHIVSDGWSIGLLMGELTKLYVAGGDPRGAGLSPLEVQYRDYAAWQRDWFTGNILQAQLGYWRSQLAGAPPALALPAARWRSPAQGAAGGRARASMPAEATEAVRGLCRKHGVTVFMVLLAAFATVLRRWSGQRDIVIGTPVTTRNDAGTCQLIGCFVNALPLRVDLSDDPTFAELLTRVRGVALDGYAHREMPFDLTVKELRPPRDPTRTPLFQAALNMVDTPQEGPQVPGVVIAVESAEAPPQPSKFDITLNAQANAESIDFELAFHGDRYDAGMMSSLLGQVCTLLSATAADPARCILDYPLPGAGHEPPAEQQPVPEPHLALAWQAARTPDRVALACAAGSWTYLQLSQAVGQVRRALEEAGPDGGRVAVVRRRTPGFVAAVLGCAGAGLPFSVLEPGQSGPASGTGFPRVLEPDEIPAESSGTRAARDAASHAASDQAVRSPHPDWAASRFDVGPGDRFAVAGGPPTLLLSALGTAFSAGATLCLPDAVAEGDVAEWLAEWLEATSVSVMYVTPPVLRALAAADPAPRLPLLRYAFIDNTLGDLTSQDVSALRRVAASSRCVALYRFTQAGEPLCVFEVPAAWSGETAPLRIPLGRGVSDVLTPGGQPAGVGELGEIRVAGQPTGDLGRILPDGVLEISAKSGAADPAETAAALRESPAVRDAVVTECRDADGHATLTAYVSCRDPRPSVSVLRQHMLARLPEYLIPRGLVLLGRLPLTADGDYDVAALPEPGDDREPEEYVAPRTPVEWQLAAIFEELLGVDRVGVYDTFFDLSGFSLLATQLVSRIRDTFRCEVPLRQVFESPTVDALAPVIVGAQVELAGVTDLDALLSEIG